MTDEQKVNPYMLMPLSRVRADALTGVSLAREAWRQRDPDGAGRLIGATLEPKFRDAIRRRRAKIRDQA